MNPEPEDFGGRLLEAQYDPWPAGMVLSFHRCGWCQRAEPRPVEPCWHCLIDRRFSDRFRAQLIVLIESGVYRMPLEQSHTFARRARVCADTDLLALWFAVMEVAGWDTSQGIRTRPTPGDGMVTQ